MSLADWNAWIGLDWIWLMQVLKVLEGHTGGVWSVDISVDGSKIVSGSDDNTVRIWSADTGEVLAWMPVWPSAAC